MSVRWKSVIGPLVDTTMPSADAGRARGQRPRRALDVDDAHAAAAVRVELRVVAERRDERAVARSRMDEQLALAGGDRTPVESELDHDAMLQRPSGRLSG